MPPPAKRVKATTYRRNNSTCASSICYACVVSVYAADAKGGSRRLNWGQPVGLGDGSPPVGSMGKAPAGGRKSPEAEAFLSRVSILLLTRDIDIVILSVCLSVTRWYCMKTA